MSLDVLTKPSFDTESPNEELARRGAAADISVVTMVDQPETADPAPEAPTPPETPKKDDYAPLDQESRAFLHGRSCGQRLGKVILNILRA